jgi:hypothetical protein
MISAGVSCPLCGTNVEVVGHHFPGETISLGGSNITLTQDAIILREHQDNNCCPCPKRLISTTSLPAPDREKIRQRGLLLPTGGYASPPILTETGQYRVQPSRP